MGYDHVDVGDHSLLLIVYDRFIGSYDTVISTSLEGLRSLSTGIGTSVLEGYV